LTIEMPDVMAARGAPRFGNRVRENERSLGAPDGRVRVGVIMTKPLLGPTGVQRSDGRTTLTFVISDAAEGRRAASIWRAIGNRLMRALGPECQQK
jgi:hypothetical protein